MHISIVERVIDSANPMPKGGQKSNNNLPKYRKYGPFVSYIDEVLSSSEATYVGRGSAEVVVHTVKVNSKISSMKQD